MKTFVLTFAVVIASPAAAATLELGGLLGYSTVALPREDSTGPIFEAVLTSSVLSLGGTDLKLGLHLGHESVTQEENNSEASWKNTYAGALAGFEVPVVPRARIQTLLGYDMGLSGEAEFKTGNVKVSRDTDEFKRVHYGVTGLFRVIPNLDVGVGLRWFQGRLELDGLDSEGYHHGFQFLATAMVPVL